MKLENLKFYIFIFSSALICDLVLLLVDATYLYLGLYLYLYL